MGGGGQSEGHQSSHSSFSPRLLPLSQEVIKGALERSQQEHSRGVLICSGDPVWKELQSLEGSPWWGGSESSPWWNCKSTCECPNESKPGPSR